VARALSRRELEGLVATLNQLQAAIRSGELDASTAMTYRIEGAVTALMAISGGSADEVLARLTAAD